MHNWFFCWVAGALLTLSLGAMASEEKEVIASEVELMFGDNLTKESSLLGYTLLAVSVDHTSAEAPQEVKNIGIPFILEYGIGHWVTQLKKAPTLDALVNNALYLLYAKQSDEAAQKAAFKLLTVAAQRNYWPAKYYIAEYNLQNYLTKDVQGDSDTMVIADPKLSQIAKTTLEYFTDCAKRGFVPCQYRLGTWMVARPEYAKKGLELLDNGVMLSLKDSRYKGFFESERLHSALLIVQLGKKFGLSVEQINNHNALLARSELQASAF